MKRYIRVDERDMIVGRGECQDEDIDLLYCPPGERIVTEFSGDVDLSQACFLESGVIVARGPRFQPVNYADQRRLAYPEIGAQLDALWHAMDDGTLPKVEPFYSDIKAVKEQFTKPSN